MISDAQYRAICAIGTMGDTSGQPKDLRFQRINRRTFDALVRDGLLVEADVRRGDRGSEVAWVVSGLGQAEAARRRSL